MRATRLSLDDPSIGQMITKTSEVAIVREVVNFILTAVRKKDYAAIANYKKEIASTMPGIKNQSVAKTGSADDASGLDIDTHDKVIQKIVAQFSAGLFHAYQERTDYQVEYEKLYHCLVNLITLPSETRGELFLQQFDQMSLEALNHDAKSIQAMQNARATEFVTAFMKNDFQNAIEVIQKYKEEMQDFYGLDSEQAINKMVDLFKDGLAQIYAENFDEEKYNKFFGIFRKLLISGFSLDEGMDDLIITKIKESFLIQWRELKPNLTLLKDVEVQRQRVKKLKEVATVFDSDKVNEQEIELKSNIEEAVAKAISAEAKKNKRALIETQDKLTEFDDKVNQLEKIITVKSDLIKRMEGEKKETQKLHNNQIIAKDALIKQKTEEIITLRETFTKQTKEIEESHLKKMQKKDRILNDKNKKIKDLEGNIIKRQATKLVSSASSEQLRKLVVLETELSTAKNLILRQNQTIKGKDEIIAEKDRIIKEQIEVLDVITAAQEQPDVSVSTRSPSQISSTEQIFAAVVTEENGLIDKYIVDDMEKFIVKDADEIAEDKKLDEQEHLLEIADPQLLEKEQEKDARIKELEEELERIKKENKQLNSEPKQDFVSMPSLTKTPMISENPTNVKNSNEFTNKEMYTIFNAILAEGKEGGGWKIDANKLQKRNVENQDLKEFTIPLMLEEKPKRLFWSSKQSLELKFSKEQDKSGVYKIKIVDSAKDKSVNATHIIERVKEFIVAPEKTRKILNKF